MSFEGKKFKKIAAENMNEVLSAMKVEEKVRKLFENPNSLTSFSKNDDGSLQHKVEVAGNKVYEKQVILDKEVDVDIPGGKVVKSFTTLTGDTLTMTFSSDEGKKVFINRVFADDQFVMTIELEGYDVKGKVTFKAE